MFDCAFDILLGLPKSEHGVLGGRSVDSRRWGRCNTQTEFRYCPKGSQALGWVGSPRTPMEWSLPSQALTSASKRFCLKQACSKGPSWVAVRELSLSYHTVDSNKLDSGCRMMYGGFPPFCWDQRTVIFQLSGFYCNPEAVLFTFAIYVHNRVI